MNVKMNVVRGDNPIAYQFDGDKVIIPGDNPIVLDFSEVPSGADVLVGELGIDHVVRAWRDDNGVMWVELRQHHGPNASHEERFPKWFNAQTGEVIEVENPV